MKGLGGQRKRLAAGVAVAAVIAAGVSGVLHQRAQLGAAPRYGQKPLPVRVARVAEGTLTVTRDYLAVVEPVQKARITARFTAAVKRVAVDEGEQVAQGDVLARLDASEVRAEGRSVAAEIDSTRAERAAEQARVEFLAASADYWKREVARTKRLAEKGMASRSERGRTEDRRNEVLGQLAAARRRVEALGGKVESLSARREQLEARLNDHVLRAPFSGTVAARQVDTGDQAAPGKTLFEVHSPGRRLAFQVPQGDLLGLEPGREVRFRLDGRQRSLPLDRLHPLLNEARLMRAEVDLTEEGDAAPTPGAYVPVEVSVERVDGAALIPVAALTESPAGRPHVFVVRQGRLAARPVTVEARSGGRAAVTGVEPGERVTVSTYLGWTRLAAGREVVVRE